MNISPETPFKAIDFIKGKTSYIYYENIDFLTVRLSPNIPLIIKLNGLVNNNDTHLLDIEDLKFVYFGLVNGNLQKVIHLKDKYDNILAFIHIKQDSFKIDGKKKNPKNYSTDIEFVGLFFYYYSYLFDYICEIFEIDKNKKNIVKRIDYCFDIAGITLFDILKFRFNTSDKSQENNFGTYKTYYRLKNERHQFVLYDKKYQILDEKKFKQKIGTVHIFKKYLDLNFPITRYEYRKMAKPLSELTENSINHLFDYIRSYAVDYFNSKIDLDFNNLFLYTEHKPRIYRDDTLVNTLTAKKIEKYLTMSMAYADNFILLKSERKFFDYLSSKFGKRIMRYFVDLYKRTEDIEFLALFDKK
ncbi:MAG: hypothetical protein PHS92_02065 [Candidatus Gracilibacteria bacterium]|nr:hypothetical protein [Candidatus Gracilibacteria bacterium]